MTDALSISHRALPQRADVVVVGAGLAGLSAARKLQEAGRDVVVIEASDGIGGRVRSDIVDGYVLDRGFQILLTAYPEVQRQFDLPALRLQNFDPGALVWREGRGHAVVDPFRQPANLVSTATAPIGSLTDKARIALLRRRVQRGQAADLLRGADIATIAALRAQGFSSKMIQRFFRPLVGGIQLDPGLGTSARMFDVIFRSLSEGDAAVPAAGMGALSGQLGARLRPDTVHLNTAALAIDGKSVRTGRGDIEADSIVVAVEGPAAERLIGTRLVGSRPATAVWFACDRPPTDSKLIVLDGEGAGPALNVAVMSNVAPTYAPAGKALVVAAVPGSFEPNAETTVRAQLERWWGPAVRGWRHLRTDTIAHGQPDQSPPFSPKRRVALGDGLFVCGDHRDTGSIQGALFSGRRAAEAVLSRPS